MWLNEFRQETLQESDCELPEAYFFFPSIHQFQGKTCKSPCYGPFSAWWVHFSFTFYTEQVDLWALSFIQGSTEFFILGTVFLEVHINATS